jgi:pyruvate/2-oxoacid:ferredoxin oxidoreductase alpha subunit
MSATLAASIAGARAMTATSSQGLALMYEMLPIASGLRAPIVMPEVNRALDELVSYGYVEKTDSTYYLSRLGISVIRSVYT